jgi:hypothetical protein
LHIIAIGPNAYQIVAPRRPTFVLLLPTKRTNEKATLVRKKKKLNITEKKLIWSNIQPNLGLGWLPKFPNTQTPHDFLGEEPVGRSIGKQKAQRKLL